MRRSSDCRVWLTSTAKAAEKRAEPRHPQPAELSPAGSPSDDIAGQGPPGTLVTLPIRLNGVERVVPLQLARVNVAAALCRGARLACDTGGFQAEVRDVPVLVARVSLPSAAPSERVRRRVAALAGDLLQLGMDAVPQAWIPIGCIPGLYVCGAPGGGVEAHVHSERVDAPGGDALRRVAESLARPLTRLAECAEVAPPVTLCELRHQRIEARCRIAASALFEGRPAALRRGSEQTAPRTDLRRELELDRHDPPLAVAHNAHVIDAMLAASAALDIDNGLWESGARRYAGRWGSCEPLVRWSSVRGDLIGELRLPVVLGHASASAAQPGASRAPLERLRSTDAMLQLACVALAASLAFSSPRWRARAARPPPCSSLPPPLPAADLDGEPSLCKRSSESGVHAVVRGRSAIAS